MSLSAPVDVLYIKSDVFNVLFINLQKVWERYLFWLTCPNWAHTIVYIMAVLCKDGMICSAFLAQLSFCIILTALKHNLCHSHLSWTQAVNFVSEICPVALWSDPLLGSLFSNHCREEKLGGSNSVQTSAQHSANPVGQDHLSVERPHNMWNTHTHTCTLTHVSPDTFFPHFLDCTRT